MTTARRKGVAQPSRRIAAAPAFLACVVVAALVASSFALVARRRRPPGQPARTRRSGSTPVRPILRQPKRSPPRSACSLRSPWIS